MVLKVLMTPCSAAWGRGGGGWAENPAGSFSFPPKYPDSCDFLFLKELEVFRPLAKWFEEKEGDENSLNIHHRPLFLHSN